MNNTTLSVFKLSPHAITPSRATAHSVGLDLYAISDQVVEANTQGIICKNNLMNKHRYVLHLRNLKFYMMV